MMVKVLALDPIHEDGLAMLRARPEIDLVAIPAPTDDEIARHMMDAEVLILRGRRLPRPVWEGARKLALVSRHGVGCDNIDFTLMGRMGVTVAVSADANYVSVAEHACALMLAACRNLIVADGASRSGAWSRRDTLGARELRDARLLLVGFGRIGRAVCDRALAFGVHVTVFDPLVGTHEVLPPGVVSAPDLHAAVAEADIISLHLPHTPATDGLFGADLLARCRPGSILVNTGRGGIVDEAALLDALDAGRPRLYATDVLAAEPPSPQDPLLRREDVIITPHSAAMTAEGARHMAIGSAQNVHDFLDGTLPRRMVAFAPESVGSRSLVGER